MYICLSFGFSLGLHVQVGFAYPTLGHVCIQPLKKIIAINPQTFLL